MILLAIFTAGVVLAVCGHTCRTVTRAASRVADSNADLARTISVAANLVSAVANETAFDKLGRTR